MSRKRRSIDGHAHLALGRLVGLATIAALCVGFIVVPLGATLVGMLCLVLSLWVILPAADLALLLAGRCRLASLAALLGAGANAFAFVLLALSVPATASDGFLLNAAYTGMVGLQCLYVSITLFRVGAAVRVPVGGSRNTRELRMARHAPALPSSPAGLQQG